MAKITSKRQVTIPKYLADRFHLESGQEIQWEAEADSIRIRLRAPKDPLPDVESRLTYFDQATRRQEQRQAHGAAASEGTPGEREWTREELYDRAVPR